MTRYGVANPGGSDLIGFRSVVITPEMVGRRIAVFAALEIKTPTGRATEQQKKFLSMVSAMGGISGVARSEDDAAELLNAQPGHL